MILTNSRVTIEEISLKFAASVGTINKIIHDHHN